VNTHSSDSNTDDNFHLAYSDLAINGSFIQKIYSTPHWIILKVRSIGQNIYFYWGRGAKFNTFFPSGIVIDSKLRIQDRFLEIVRSSLSGLKISRILKTQNDQVYAIMGQRGRNEIVFSIGYFINQAFFVTIEKNEYSIEILSSWNKKRRNLISQDHIEVILNNEWKELPDEFKHQQFKPCDEMMTNWPLDYIDYIKSTSRTKLEKTERKIETKIRHIDKDINGLEKDIQLLETYITSEEIPEIIKLSKKNLKFKTKGHFKKRNELFNKIKNLKSGLEIQRKRVAACEHKDFEQAKNGQGIKPISPFWKDLKSTEEKASEKKEYSDCDFYCFLTGGKIAIGKNNLANDQLRNTWAKKEDWWFHIDGEKSAHVFFKKIETPTIEELEIIAAILKHYSDKIGDKIGLLFTKVKYLSAIKGSPGLVKYKKEKKIIMTCANDWEEKVTT